MRKNRAGCLAALWAWLGLAPRQGKYQDLESPFPYRIRDDFLSPAEISFFHVLKGIVGDKAVVCPKVSLGDLFFAATGDYAKNRSWMNRIDRKHVDFLICDPGTMQPRLGVELDDASHATAKREERDQFVETVFTAAGLPLARVAAQQEYNTTEVAAQLRRAVVGAVTESGEGAPTAPAQTEPLDAEATQPPPCPRCGTPMVLREVKRQGPHKGERFWGCPNFPRCRGTREPVDV